MPIFIGIDPGLADMGFGVVSVSGGQEKCLAYGSIKTPAGQPTSERLLALFVKFGAALDEYRPVRVGIEKLFFQKNVKTAMVVAEARGGIRLAAGPPDPSPLLKST